MSSWLSESFFFRARSQHTVYVWSAIFYAYSPSLFFRQPSISRLITVDASKDVVLSPPKVYYRLLVSLIVLLPFFVVLIFIIDACCLMDW